MVGNESVEIYDIYGVWHVPFWQTQTFIMSMWSIAILLAIALIYLIVRFFKSRKKQLKPWQWANNELDALWERRGFTREDGKRFYSQLTDIMKMYVEKRYSYAVLSATDIEFLAYMKDRHLPAALMENLEQIFDGVQEIKFANLDAIPENIERDFALAKAFVANTISEAPSTRIQS
jgi:signal transduction histidine kinase